jgi:hypothetical protein
VSLRDAAVAYARAGLSVHPLPPGEKKSRLPWAHRQRELLLPGAANDHWTDNPDDNIAIVTGALSGVVVVDVDPAHGGDPSPFQGTTPVVARTRSGGWHFYYRHPGRPVKSCAGPNKDLPGVDVRGDGGYVVAPPSTVGGKTYRWECERLGEIPNGLPSFEVVERLVFPPAPAQPERAAEMTFEAADDSPGWVSELLSKGAPIGEQRQALTRLAGYFATKGVPADIAYQLIFPRVMAWKQDRRAPWMPYDVKALIESIYDKDARNPRGGDEATSASADTSATGVASPELLECVHIDAFVEKYGADTRDAWLVEDWLPEGTVAMVQSPPGSYKTWLLCDLAISVASGNPFLQRYPVHRSGPVLFIQQEDPRSLLAFRLGLLKGAKEDASVGANALEFRALEEGPPVFLVTDGGFNFGNVDARKRLVQRVAALRPALVILDPLYTACPAGQFFMEMPTHLQWLRRLRDEFGCAFLLAHHTKKVNADTGDLGREQMWGSNLMNAAIESGWIVRPLNETTISVRRHFKVTANIEARRFEFTIDVDRTPAFVCEESDMKDPAVDDAEQDELDDVHNLLLATLRQEGKPLATSTLARLAGKPLSSVQRKVHDLVQRGLLLRDENKRLVLTKVQPQEVA